MYRLHYVFYWRLLFIIRRYIGGGAFRTLFMGVYVLTLLLLLPAFFFLLLLLFRIPNNRCCRHIQLPFVGHPRRRPQSQGPVSELERATRARKSAGLFGLLHGNRRRGSLRHFIQLKCLRNVQFVHGAKWQRTRDRRVLSRMSYLHDWHQRLTYSSLIPDQRQHYVGERLAYAPPESK
jgi:hypothetical protein